MTIKLRTVVVILIISSISGLRAQNASELFSILKTKDSLLFEKGFNQCDLDIIGQLVTDDIEFYHDRDGITTSKTKFLSAIQNNLCSSEKNRITRVLDKASFKVFPLYKGAELYGAIQNGTHGFGQTKATYSHLWLIQGQEWKLARVFSYDHHTAQDVFKNKRLDLSTSELQKYIGEYEFSPEFVLTVRIKNGDLFGGSQGQEVKISCYDKNKFIDEEQTHDLEFLTDTKGNITSLFMKGSGMEMTGQKRK